MKKLFIILALLTLVSCATMKEAKKDAAECAKDPAFDPMDFSNVRETARTNPTFAEQMASQEPALEKARQDYAASHPGEGGYSPVGMGGSGAHD